MRARLASRLASFLGAVLGAVLFGALVRGPAFAADDEPTVVTDTDHDFAWTIPAGWTKVDPTAAEREQGYYVKAKRVVSEGVEAMANVFVKDAGDTSLDTFVSIMKDNKSKALKEPEASDEDVAWAGTTSAKKIEILGHADNGSAIKWFVRAAIVGGRYHQVSVMSSNGAHAEIGAEIDAILAGYRILSAPPPAEGGGAEGGAGGAAKVECTNLGLTWTLPSGGKLEEPPVKEGDPARVYTWGFVKDFGNPALKRLESGDLARAALLLNDEPVITATLALPKTNAVDISPAGIVRTEGNFEGFAKAFDGVAVPNVDEDAKVGNARGACRTLSGKSAENQKPLWIRAYFVTLQKQLFEVLVIANDGYEQKKRDWLKGMMDGLVWADTSVGVRGPLVAPFATASDDRGNGWLERGKKKTVKGAVSFTKPAQFGELKLAGEPGWVYAAETRKPGVYLFVGIMRLDLKQFTQQTPARDPESLIDDHENAWRNDVDKPNTRPKSDKTNRKPDTFRGAKGASYEFRGEKGGFPFFEKGYVVKAGQSVYHVRAQFGGKDAEKALDGDWKDFAGSIKFD